MSLNPSYDSQQDRPLPVLFGYASGSGDAVFATTDPVNNEYQFLIAFDGECDGPEQLVPTATASLLSEPSTIFFPANTNFHAGSWTPIGLDPIPASAGPDQCVDEFFTQVPTLTPPQSLSNIAYVAAKLPAPSTVLPGLGRFATGNVPMSCFGVWRGARCRYFDASGNVTGYGFTTNPTWHIVESLLRFRFKRQQPQVAGLTPAEKACFNWPSIVAHAQRNDFPLANGFSRFMGNYVFAANSTLGAMIELMLRCCRSYLDEQDGQVGLYGHDATASTFTLTANHVLPGTFKLWKKDLTRKPNVFIPKFRDLNIPAVLPVLTCRNTNAGEVDGNASVPAGRWCTRFDTGGQNPFEYGSFFFYGDSSNPAMTRDYEVTANPSTTSADPAILAAGVALAETAVGGYIGTQNSRFQPRAPNTVQHRAHQKATGLVAAGVTGVPNVVPVSYDLGNMTYDQANRLMQYERNTTLGMDGAGWQPPRQGSATVRLDAVDASGNAFIRMRPREQQGHFTIDETLSPEWQGDGIITSLQINPPTAKDAGSIDIEWIEFIPGGYPDASAPPSNSYQTIASAALSLLGTSQQLNGVAWTMQATAAATLAGDGTMTVTVPDLSVWFQGATAATGILNAVWTGLTSGAAYIFYIEGDPTAGVPWVFGRELVADGPLGIGAGEQRFVVFVAKLTAS